MTHCHQGIHRLTGLRDSYDKGGAINNWVAISILAGNLYLYADLCPLFNRILCNHSRVISGTACDDNNLFKPRYFSITHMQLIDQDLIVIAQAPNQGVSNSFRLFKDFFQHEVCKATLLCRRCIPRNLIFTRCYRLSSEINNFYGLWSNCDDFILA